MRGCFQSFKFFINIIAGKKHYHSLHHYILCKDKCCCINTHSLAHAYTQTAYEETVRTKQLYREMPRLNRTARRSGSIFLFFLLLHFIHIPDFFFIMITMLDFSFRFFIFLSYRFKSSFLGHLTANQAHQKYFCSLCVGH